jgi:hypothetical protein
MQDMAKNELIKKVVGTIYDDLIKYYGLYGFIKLKKKHLFSKPIEINSESDFWESILKADFKVIVNEEHQELRDGQILIFRDFYLSEWAPKLPGRLWTKEGLKLMSERFNHIQSIELLNEELQLKFDPNGKKKAILGGLGSVRVNPTKNPYDFYMYMSITSGAIWSTDFGIPIVVSKSVYDEFKKKTGRIGGKNYEGVWIEKMEGQLMLEKDLPLTDFIANSVGGEISSSLKDALTRATFLPKCYVYVPSILNARLISHDNHPESVAWTLYRKNLKEDWQKSISKQIDKEYSYTYAYFNPAKRDSIKDAVVFIENYVRDDYGECMLTDFDGIEPRLNARLNLFSNPIVNQKDKSKITIVEISEWDKKLEKLKE